MTVAWAALTAQTVGSHRRPTTPNNFWYRCVAAGTTAASEPQWPTALGARVTDGSVVWQAVMPVATDVQMLAPTAVVEMFVLDATGIGGTVTRWHGGKNMLLASLVWQGETYAPIPIRASGFEFSTGGKLPRPKLQVANANGILSALVLQYGDLLNAKVTRKRTLVKYLDIANWLADSGTAQAGAAATLTLRAGASAVDDAYNGRVLRLMTGAGSVQERTISDYNGTTKVATLSSGWRVNLIARSEEVDLWAGAAGVTANAFADPDGAMTIDTIVDDDAATFESRSRSLAVPNDGATYNISVLIRKDFAATQRSGFNVGLTGGGTPINQNIRFALDGTNVSGAGSPAMTSYDANHWLLSWSITNNSTGNTALGINAYPATAPTKGGTDLASAVGSMSLGRLHVRRSTDNQDYIKTDAAAITLPDATSTYEVRHTNYGDAQPDPTAEFPDDVYFIDRKSAETKKLVEFELAPASEVRGVMLPRRQIVQNVCAWAYRGAECGYAGGAVAKIDDTPTAILGEDKCGKRLASCKLRFGEYAELPFGGFPAAGLIR
jgi:phage-related protein